MPCTTVSHMWVVKLLSLSQLLSIFLDLLGLQWYHRVCHQLGKHGAALSTTELFMK